MLHKLLLSTLVGAAVFLSVGISTHKEKPKLVSHATTLTPTPTPVATLAPVTTPVAEPTEAPVRPATPQPAGVRQAEPGVYAGGSCAAWIASAGIDNPSAATFIFQHESGCRPDAVNGSGCRGIGQACPGSKLPCGNDGYCQARWFDGYAHSRYGTWGNAESFWQSHHYW